MKSLSILIVEDQVLSSSYLAEILTSLDSLDIYEIFYAKDSQRALEIVKNEEIDLVFMDINIDGSLNGIECANIINQEYFLPIIFTTAYADSKTIKEASKSNVFGYIIKPFDTSDVESTVSVVLKVLDTKQSLEYKEVQKNIIVVGDYEYIKSKKMLLHKDKAVDLTIKELEMIDVLFSNYNRHITYSSLKEKIWNKDTSNSTIRDLVSRIKKKLPTLNIENISSVGYCLKK